ncbi:uncharacterized protein [Medicago truncatula]|uniref:uncharacterized protein isoform X2 n=1 Tax=Medicago truncatula TaxID=3880 RepID=UPI000D2F2D9D|nr:uncharacterized protein LOC25488822 isoform X2 [Medicago truncatula]
MDEETEVAATECAVGVGATKGAVGVGSTEGVIEAKANPESTQQAAAELPPFPTTRCKRPNANGNRRTSSVWLDFNPLPNEREPTTACKHCHKRYRCDSKLNGKSSMLAHCRVYLKKSENMLNDPRQTNLINGKGGFLLLGVRDLMPME